MAAGGVVDEASRGRGCKTTADNAEDVRYVLADVEHDGCTTVVRFEEAAIAL